MSGRDPNEAHRAATPLELFFDLVFVVAFGQASNEFAHMLAEGHYVDGLIGFAFTMFAVVWAWGNFTWFASAFDTDDWVYRLLTMVQMTGVLVLALGIPDIFESIHEGERLANGVAVLGYVIMRLAMVSQWLRAAHDDPKHHAAALAYGVAVAVAQVGWIAVWWADPPIGVFAVCGIVLYILELAGPRLAERKSPTPWHAHHIAERYMLLTIIALGECVIGTFDAIQAVIDNQGWSGDVVVVGLAGMALALGLWWMYVMEPSGAILQSQRPKATTWAYMHLVLFATIAATGAGLHVAAYYIEHVAHIGALPVVLTVALPVAAYIVVFYAMYTYLIGVIDPFHYSLVAGSAVVLALAVIAAAVGVPVPLCLLIVMLAPMVTVAGWELLGHVHQAEALANVGHARAGGED